MKIGILTMHRVVNYGSTLQAYALQHFLFEQGYDNEIIDYQFAPKPLNLKDWFRYILKGNFIKYIKFKQFWKSNYILSSQTYKNRNKLTESSCKYDIYLTGSDQVWNPKHNGNELTFMFDFIKNSKYKKIAYAASFSTGKITDEKTAQYKTWLSHYETISVREKNAIALVRQITGKDGIWVCDPTLLLDKATWNKLGEKSQLKINKPYILFYILTYAYNPYPQINNIINRIQDEFKGKLSIFLDGKISDKKRDNSIVISNISPYDFIYLIKNADFIVTTSFHGTAFAINFRKPFYSVIQSNTTLDDRMYSLLDKVGLKQRAILYDNDFQYNNMEYDINIEQNINKFVTHSKHFLTKILN